MLGDILRQEREKQNMTVKDVEVETSIRALYISSIEEGKYDALPGEVYLKGFIRTYSSCLKLDPIAMLKLYYEEKNQQPAPVSSEIFDAKPAEAQQTAANILDSPAEQVEESSVREKVRSAKRDKESRLTKFFAASVAVVVVAGLCYWGFGTTSEPDPVPVPVAGKQVQAVPVPEKKLSQPVVPAKQIKGVEITAKYTGKSWTKVVADNKTIYEGIPQNGENLTWKADRAIVFRSGNAGAVEITHNGKIVGTLGNSGEVVVKQFTTDRITDSK